MSCTHSFYFPYCCCCPLTISRQNAHLPNHLVGFGNTPCDREQNRCLSEQVLHFWWIYSIWFVNLITYLCFYAWTPCLKLKHHSHHITVSELKSHFLLDLSRTTNIPKHSKIIQHIYIYTYIYIYIYIYHNNPWSLDIPSHLFMGELSFSTHGTELRPVALAAHRGRNMSLEAMPMPMGFGPGNPLHFSYGSYGIQGGWWKGSLRLRNCFFIGPGFLSFLLCFAPSFLLVLLPFYILLYLLIFALFFLGNCGVLFKRCQLR